MICEIEQLGRTVSIDGKFLKQSRIIGTLIRSSRLLAATAYRVYITTCMLVNEMERRPNKTSDDAGYIAGSHTDAIAFHLAIPARIARQHLSLLTGPLLWGIGIVLWRIIARLGTPGRHFGMQKWLSEGQMDRIRRRKILEMGMEMGSTKADSDFGADADLWSERAYT